MTALSDALVASQARVVSALAKAYVGGAIDRDDVIEALIAVGLRDAVDTEQWLAALDLIREHGGTAPGEQPAKVEEPASEAQWKFLRQLADEKGMVAPDGPLTKAQASQAISALQHGSYRADEWTVPF